MADATDVVLQLLLTLRDEASPALTAFNARLAEQKTMLDAANAKTVEATAVQNGYGASVTKTVAASKAASVENDLLSAKYIAAQDKETIASGRQADARIAQSQRAVVAVARGYEQEAVAAEASAKKQTASIATVNKSFSQLGLGANLIGLAVVGMAAKSVVSLDTAEHHVMAFTNAIGNGANQIPLAKMRSEIQALADQTGISAAKITEGFYNIASSGLSADKTYAILTNSTRFATASQTDAAVASGLLTAVTNAYHLSLAQIPQAQDDISQSVLQGTMEARDYAPALAQIIPVAAHLGVGLKDLGAWFTVSTNAGISAAESGVYFGNMLNQVLAPTYKQIKAVQDLGGTYDDLTVKHGNVQATLSRLNDLVSKHVVNLKELEGGTGKVTQRAEIFAEQLSHADGKVRALFGGNMEAAKAFFILNANGGAQTSAALKGMQNDAGATERAYRTAMTSMANQVKLVVQKIDEAERQMAGPFVADALSAAKAIGDVNKATDGGAATAAKWGLELGAMALVFTKTVQGWQAVAAAAKAARLAEIAALALSPVGFFGAVAGIGAYEGNKKLQADNLDALKRGQKDVTKAFDEGKISEKQAQVELQRISDLAKLTGTSIKEISDAKLLDTKIAYQDHLKAEATGAGELANHIQSARAQLVLLNREQGASGKAPTGPPAIVDLTKEIADAQKHVNDAVNQANTDIEAYGHVLTAHQAALDRWKTTLATLQGRLSSLTDTTHLYTAANKAAENELKSLNATQQQMAADGLAKEQAAFTSMADTAISQARRMKSGVVSEYDAMLVHITKSIPVAALSIPASARVETSFLGPNQFSTKGSEGSPAASAVGLAPELGTRMDALTTAIHGLPPEFQGAFDSEITKFHSEEAALYKTYITDLNKENAADAAAINKINDTYHKQIAQNLADAQAKDKAEHDRYLAAIDGAESKHNSTLAGNLQTFNTNFATSLANYQAQVVQAQTKAASDSTQHEDRLRQLEADNLAKLAAVHGKGAAEQRANIEAGYAKSVGQENDNYNRTVSHDEAHLQGLADAFDRHVKGIKDTFDRQAKAADTQLGKDLKTAKGNDKTALAGIQSWLDGKDNKAEAAREAALAKEAGIYIKVVNGIVEAFDKGGKLIAQHIKEGTTPQAMVATLQSGAQAAYDKAYSQTILDILAHGKATKADIVALALATKGQDDLTSAQNKAKNSLYDLSVSAELLGAHFGRVGQPAPGVPSIATTVGGGGFAATAPGVITGGIALENTFKNLVKSGDDAAKSQEVQTHANYQVAKDTGDTATEFSILNTAFLAGKTSIDGLPVTLEGVVAAYHENQDTVLATTRRLIDFDKATGNTADELAQTLTLYHQNNASLADLTSAYNDNQAAVAKTTAQDLAFYVATGQWSAAMNSLTSSLTGPLADANAKLAYDFYTHSGNIEADTQSVKDHQAALDALTQATWDASYTAANPAQQSQMLNTLAQPMISAQSAQASSEQAVANAQLGVIAANSALEVAGINAMTTQIQDMGGIIKAESAVSAARFSGQLAALNDLIPIQNDLYALAKATTPQMLQTAQEQLKIDRLTAVMDQDKAAWDIKLAQMQLQLAQDKMMVDAANAQAQMTIAMDNLAIANDALNVAVAQAKLQADSLVIQNAIHTDLGGVQDYLNLIDGDLQNLSAAQDQQMADQSQLGYDTGSANEIAAGGAGLLAGDQLSIDQGTAAAAASNQAYQLQLAQYKVEQNQQQLQQQLVNNQQQDNASLLSEIKTLQGIIAFQNSPASRRPLRSVGNVSTAQLINGWAATAASTQAA